MNKGSEPFPYHVPGPFPPYNADCFNACPVLPPIKTIPLPGDKNCVIPTNIAIELCVRCSSTSEMIVRGQGNHTPPAPPPPPPPPPPPLSTNPCLRFGHAIPVDDHVDAEIVQDEDASISHTWTNFK